MNLPIEIQTDGTSLVNDGVARNVGTKSNANSDAVESNTDSELKTELANGGKTTSGLKPFSHSLTRFREKLMNPTVSVPGSCILAERSDLPHSTDSGEIQPSMDVSSVVAPAQTQARSAPVDSSTFKPTSTKLAKPYIEEFSLPSVDSDAPSEQTNGSPDLTLGKPDRFPVAAFPESMQEIAKQLASVYQSPVCVSAMCLLAALSAAVGKSVVVLRAVRDLATMLNLFVMIVAERGTCKSVIGSKATAPIQAFSETLVTEHNAKVAAKKTELGILKKDAARHEAEIGKSVGSDRVSRIAELTQKHLAISELEGDADRRVTAIEADITGEALVRSLQDNRETLFSYSPEAGAVVSVAGGKYKDGKSDLDPYLSGYSGDPLRATRVDRASVVVHQPCLTLLWLMQSVIASDLVGCRDTIPRGFTARTLLFDSGARREHDNRKDESFTMADRWAAILHLQLCRRQLDLPPKEIVCSPEAREVFARFNDEGVDLERNWCPDLTGEFSRQRENAIKVAGLFALAEGEDVVDENLAQRAVSVIRWVGFNYLTMMQSERKVRLKRDLDRVLEILSKCDGSIGLGPLAQYHGIKREKIEALILVFHDTLAIKKIPQPEGKAGRPAEILTLISKTANVVASGNKIEKIEKLTGRNAAA